MPSATLDPRLWVCEGNVQSQPLSGLSPAHARPPGGEETKQADKAQPAEEALMPATGKITQVIGSTFDAAFPADQLPRIYNAIKVDAQNDGRSIHLVGE